MAVGRDEMSPIPGSERPQAPGPSLLGSAATMAVTGTATRGGELSVVTNHRPERAMLEQRVGRLGLDMDAKHIKVTAVDQHPLVLEAIAARIGVEEDMILIAAETSARRGLQAIANGKPDVAVIAIPLSDMNGLGFVERIVKDHPATQVVILSMYEDRALVQQALRVGARAYISKRSPVGHLLQAITAVAEGALYIDPTITSKIFGSPGNRSSRRPAHNANLDPSLTERETDTVRLIALGYTGKEIAAQLGVSAKSVETVKSRASEKLNLRTRAQLVRYAAAQGWLETVHLRIDASHPLVLKEA